MSNAQLRDTDLRWHVRVRFPFSNGEPRPSGDGANKTRTKSDEFYSALIEAGELKHPAPYDQDDDDEVKIDCLAEAHAPSHWEAWALTAREIATAVERAEMALGPVEIIVWNRPLRRAEWITRDP